MTTTTIARPPAAPPTIAELAEALDKLRAALTGVKSPRRPRAPPDAPFSLKCPPEEEAAPVIALRVPEAERVSGIRRTKMYEAIARGDLVARKDGATTLIMASDLEAYVRSLPRMEPARLKLKAKPKPKRKHPAP